jgi:hypothetical protein
MNTNNSTTYEQKRQARPTTWERFVQQDTERRQHRAQVVEEHKQRMAQHGMSADEAQWLWA